jgi:hypothetical protein
MGELTGFMTADNNEVRLPIENANPKSNGQEFRERAVSLSFFRKERLCWKLESAKRFCGIQ